jgi:hypothetical protein
MGVAVADRPTRARGSQHASQPASGDAGERLPVVVTVVAIAVFAAAWLGGLLPALREERQLAEQLRSAQQLESHVRTQLEDRRQSLHAMERDPEELIRAMDETRTLPPAPAPVSPARSGARTAQGR